MATIPSNGALPSSTPPPPGFRPATSTYPQLRRRNDDQALGINHGRDLHNCTRRQVLRGQKDTYYGRYGLD
jgi:hypothetical protein